MAQRVLFVGAAALMLGLSASMAWATVSEYGQRHTIPAGVVAGDTDLSGMDATQARGVIEREIGAPLFRPVTVRTPDGEKVFKPEAAVTLDVDAMVNEAFQARTDATFTERLASTFGNPMDVRIEPKYRVNEKKIVSWVAAQSKLVDIPVVDADVTVDGNTPVVRREIIGRQVDQASLVSAIRAGIERDARTVDMPVRTLQPKVTTDSLPKVIVVDKSDKHLTLYQGARKIKSWNVAVGQPKYPTPEGRWEIVAKRPAPTWHNPGSEWAKDMPESIPPGPANPLGVRALNLNADGIRIHGTQNIASLGTAASHGCIRMANSQIVELFDMVPMGTAVWVVK